MARGLVGRSVMLLMMRTAEPPDGQWLRVVVMVSVGAGLAADFTRLPLKHVTSECSCDNGGAALAQELPLFSTRPTAQRPCAVAFVARAAIETI